MLRVNIGERQVNMAGPGVPSGNLVAPVSPASLAAPADGTFLDVEQTMAPALD